MAGPQHQKSRHFTRTGLFANLGSFADLEKRIADLPTEQDRGDAFEVFAEAYFATQPIAQAKQVWPSQVVPPSVREQLSLPVKDMGIDGLIATTAGTYDAYQVKFRAGRGSLTWSELSTFMGLADKASQRIVFTNSNDLPSVINERVGYYCIRGADLDRLEARDFEAIIHWLELGQVTRKQKEPLPHQQEALTEIVGALQKQDRVTTVMACGSGKTLVELWAAERMGCRTVLVLVPSLALIRQTLHEWLRETRWPSYSYLCVCSDPTVTRGADELIVHQSDLDFPVTTNSEDVKQFLERPFDGVRIVFSTYQSADKVADGAKGLAPFELGIFDEAHKTAGREGTRFSFSLEDKNFPIKKRLFLTATPRHYDVRQKDVEGDARLVYSMDVPVTYGPVAYRLTFAEAVRRDIICGYKVLISVVTSGTVTEHLLRTGSVIVDNNPVKAQQVANQIAILKAVEKYGVKRIFTFHNNVESARSFVASGAEGISAHLTMFKTFHVNGAMRTAERDGLMQEFRNATHTLMTNARCLTEGVDVPAVDMVAFMSPRRSTIDIVQATGRAMRKSPKKTIGYVLVPVYLDQANDESIQDAVARSNFTIIWDVLEALLDQDEALTDTIREMREDLGRTRVYDDQKFSEKIEILNSTIELESLRQAITAQCVEHLGSSWDERYGELVAYKKNYGNCDVPWNWPINQKLANWCINQRIAFKNGKLGQGRITQLERLEFVFTPAEANWEAEWLEMFHLLAEFKKKEKHCNVPYIYTDNPTLSRWCSRQRYLYKKNNLSPHHIARLKALGFELDLEDSKWEKMFERLLAYKEIHKNFPTVRRLPEDPVLGRWCFQQRNAYQKRQLSPERIARLEAIGFTLDPDWEVMFQALVAYKEKYSHCIVPTGSQENPVLGRWCFQQRNAYQKRQLWPERIARLEAIGFHWYPEDVDWEEMFQALVAYKEKSGNCNVPIKWPENPALGKWCRKQQYPYKKKQLSPERIARLEAIGFWSRPGDKFWEEKFQALVAFKKEMHHCNVPRGWPENPWLARWCDMQRHLYRNNKLEPERVTRLENLGFIFDLTLDP